MALNVWVTWRTPAATAATMSSHPASVCPAATATPRPTHSAITSPAPASPAPAPPGARRRRFLRAAVPPPTPRRPGTARAISSSRRASATSGGRIPAGSWAPARAGLIQGPSRWAPRIVAPPSTGPARHGDGGRPRPRGPPADADHVVGSRAVTPWVAWKRAMRRRPSGSASMASAPSPPWTCTSMKPGSSTQPRPSTTTPRALTSARTPPGASPGPSAWIRPPAATSHPGAQTPSAAPTWPRRSAAAAGRPRERRASGY